MKNKYSFMLLSLSRKALLLSFVQMKPRTVRERSQRQIQERDILPFADDPRDMIACWNNQLQHLARLRNQLRKQINVCVCMSFASTQQCHFELSRMITGQSKQIGHGAIVTQWQQW
jgi:hypothetical protein